MHHQEAELKQQRIQINQGEMIERISRAVETLAAFPERSSSCAKIWTNR